MNLGSDPGEESRASDLFQNALSSIILCPCPVVAMIYGYALGAGCGLVAFMEKRKPKFQGEYVRRIHLSL